MYELTKDDMAGDDDAKENESEEEDDWKTLLTKWGLAKFADAFEEEGYDDPQFWHEISENDLKDDMGMKKGHLKKWNLQIQKYQERKALKEQRKAKEELKEDDTQLEGGLDTNESKEEVAEAPKKKIGGRPSPIVNGQHYSLHGYYNGVEIAYLSYHAERGWCRQTYENAKDSRWEFIESGFANKYFIRNKYPDKRVDKWLSYGKWDDGSQNMVGLYTKMSDSGLWELVPDQSDVMAFKLKCHYNGQCIGWLSFRNDGRWNKLYDNEVDASVYKLEPYFGDVVCSIHF